MKTNDYMARAIALAERGRGRTNPNPMVGAVIVKKDTVIGEGYHKHVGGPHAEVEAIRGAAGSVKGAKMYVTLEPCSIEGRTPPCTDLIIDSGIKEVVIGAIDPNPRVNGRGIEKLKIAGINVSVAGDFSKKIADQNEIFFKYIKTGKPFTLCKAAVSVNGSISFRKGEKSKLSSEAADKFCHRLRDEYDAIMVGVETVITDDPQLTARLNGKNTRNPIRVVVDSAARMPPESQIAAGAKNIPTYLATLKNADQSRLEKLMAGGINIISVKADRDRVDLEDLLDWLGRLEISSLIIEGGAALFTSFVKKDLVDKYIFVITPVLIGGKDKVELINTDIDLLKKMRLADVHKLGPDLIAEYYPEDQRED